MPLSTHKRYRQMVTSFICTTKTSKKENNNKDFVSIRSWFITFWSFIGHAKMEEQREEVMPMNVKYIGRKAKKVVVTIIVKRNLTTVKRI
jgi:hypothetical protein